MAETHSDLNSITAIATPPNQSAYHPLIAENRPITGESTDRWGIDRSGIDSNQSSEAIESRNSRTENTGDAALFTIKNSYMLDLIHFMIVPR
jgi:hypothetical protein